MKFLIAGLLVVVVNAFVAMCFPAIDGGILVVDRSDQTDRARTLGVNAFDILGLFGRRGGFLRPIIQNTIGNGNAMTLQTGITLLNSLVNSFTETGGSNKDGFLGLNFV